MPTYCEPCPENKSIVFDISILLTIYNCCGGKAVFLPIKKHLTFAAVFQNRTYFVNLLPLYCEKFPKCLKKQTVVHNLLLNENSKESIIICIDGQKESRFVHKIMN